MEIKEIEKLRYRRQYLIAPREINCPFQHTKYRIHSNYFLYTHIELNFNEVRDHDHSLFLLGDLFDFEYPLNNNSDILLDLLPYELSDLLVKINKYTGRFVLIYVRDQHVILIHDAAAARKVFYTKTSEGNFCASQPHLLARVTNQIITVDPIKLKFYSSKEFIVLNNANIGNTTCYDQIFQLVPNHFLDLETNTETRYWPNKKIGPIPYCDAVIQCSNMLKGIMESIANRYDVMLPVTAGKDSRLLMAATKDIKEKIYYYINKEKSLTNSSSDIQVPSQLFRILDIDFHILDPYHKIDEDFKTIYFENNPMASERYLPIIYNYYLHFQDKVNLPGIFINCVEDIYEFGILEITPNKLAGLIETEAFDYAQLYYKEWYNKAIPACKNSDLNVLNLFYWEERIANWGTQTQLDKDIAQEDIIPYNSRLLIELLFSIELRFREKPYYSVFREMTKKLWPELLIMRTNSDFKTSVLKVSKKLRILTFVKKVYYSLLK